MNSSQHRGEEGCQSARPCDLAWLGGVPPLGADLWRLCAYIMHRTSYILIVGSAEAAARTYRDTDCVGWASRFYRYDHRVLIRVGDEYCPHVKPKGLACRCSMAWHCHQSRSPRTLVHGGAAHHVRMCVVISSHYGTVSYGAVDTDSWHDN